MGKIGRFLLALGLVALAAAGCSPRLDEQRVRLRLVEQLKLQSDQLRVVSISREASPVATLEYGGVRFGVRFRLRDGVWVIDAVQQDGRWQAADRAVPVVGRDLAERARARWLADVMPRYARTLKLLTGWADLMSYSCSDGLPASEKALADLHAMYHRALFPNRGTEFHNSDLFVRDAWLRPLRATLTTARVEVHSGGADGRLDTADDVRMTFVRTPVREGIGACMPHYTMPSFVVDALGQPNAPQQWNCAGLLTALKKAQVLDVVEASR